MTERTVTITNETGLHARPASLFYNFIKKFDCEITLKSGGKSSNPKSILNLLALGLGKGSEVTICVEGENEEKIAEEIADYLANLKD